MLRIRLNSDGKDNIAQVRAHKAGPAPLPKAGSKVSVARVAEILRISPSIVRGFFVSTQDHRKYPADHPLDVLLKLKDHQLYFSEAMLMVWFDANYVGMRELYYTRKEQWLKSRASQ